MKLIKCNCESEYQDNTYGVGNRVHNLAIKNNKWRCVVCGNEKVESKETKEKIIAPKGKK